VEIKRIAGAIGRAWRRAGDWVLVACCFLLALLLYLQTLAPSVATLLDDSLEFPLAAYTLAIAHPTGYPLYMLLGKLVSLGPWSNVAWALNLLSAMAGALTLALTYLIARELTRPPEPSAGRRWPALLGAAALAVSPLFWSQAIIAEVYTLNSTFFAALIWLALRWAREPLLPIVPFSLLLETPSREDTLFLPDGSWRLRLPVGLRRMAHRLHAFYRRFFPPVPPKQRLRLHPRLYALLVLFGFGLTHHRTIVLLAPALLVFALLVERRVFSRAALLGPEHPERPRWQQVAGRPVVLLAACLLAPLLLYLYLPLRGHVGSLDGLYVNNWRGFWQWVTGSIYGAFLGENPLARNLDAAFYARLFWEQFGPVGLALALVGLIGLWRRPRHLVLTGLAFAAYVAFAVVWQVPDVEVFFIPALVLIAIWIGVGLDHAADLLRIRGRSLAVRRLVAVSAVVVMLAAVVQPVVIAVRAYPDLDLSRRWIVHDYGQYILREPLPSNSTIVGILGEMTLLRYFQRTTGLRPDIETVAANAEDARLAAIEEALAQGRSVYTTRPLPGLAERHSLGAVTGLIDVAGELEALILVGDPALRVPDLPRPTDLELVPGLELLGYGLREHQGHWQDWARLRLWWRAPEGLEEPLKVSARLVNADGQLVAAIDAEPVVGAYPATDWRPGEVVVDAYEIPLPAGLPPGDYAPLIIAYEPDTGRELGRAELAPVALAGNPARPPRRALEGSVGETLCAQFGDVALLGFSPPDPQVAYLTGDSLPLVLLWQALGQTGGDLRLSFWLEGEGKAPLGEEPVGGHFPVEHWTAGQVVRQWPAVSLPQDTPPGSYRLKMRVTRDGQPAPWGCWLLPLGSDLDLGPVQVGP